MHAIFDPKFERAREEVHGHLELVGCEEEWALQPGFAGY
jgi:hypothetical protein